MSRFRLRRAMLALAGAVLLLAHTPPATAMDPVISRMAGFDPSFLISDAVMDDASTMTRDEVIAFVAARGAQCRPAADGTPCLKDAVVDTPARAATPYCAAMQGSTAEPAASYVWRVSQACGINPQVLLVLMQREQSIVSTVSPTQKMYTSTLGFACRDGIPCDPAYDGLVNQVYAAASRLNEYREPANRYRYQVGGTYAIPLYPGKPECGTWTVQMRSAATAALYNYTPFVPNPAALDNPYGAGDACSTYGNRNFY